MGDMESNRRSLLMAAPLLLAALGAGDKAGILIDVKLAPVPKGNRPGSARDLRFARLYQNK